MVYNHQKNGIINHKWLMNGIAQFNNTYNKKESKFHLDGMYNIWKK